MVARRRQYRLSVAACLIAVWAGYALAASINALKWI